MFICEVGIWIIGISTPKIAEALLTMKRHRVIYFRANFLRGQKLPQLVPLFSSYDGPLNVRRSFIVCANQLNPVLPSVRE
jgi:hypothetical protein